MSARSSRLPDFVSIRVLARLLKVDERTIRRWQNPKDDKGEDAPRLAIPFEKKGTETTFPLEACIAWFVDYRVSIASRSVSELDLARQRKVTAEAEMAELDLAARRLDLVPVEATRTVMADIASRLRAQLLAVPGRYSARIVNLATLPDAQRALDHAMRDVLNELKEG